MITKPQVRAAFRCWKEVLCLRDLKLTITFPKEQGDSDLSIEPCGSQDDNRHEAIVSVYQSGLELKPTDFFELAGHELLHVICWPVDNILIACEPWLSKEAKAAAKRIETLAVESICYKLSPIIARMVRQNMTA